MAENIYKLMGIIIVGGAATVHPELDSTTLWHRQLGHMGKHGMMELHKRINEGYQNMQARVLQILYF